MKHAKLFKIKTKKSNVQKHSQPLPWGSKLSSVASCFHWWTLRCLCSSIWVHPWEIHLIGHEQEPSGPWVRDPEFLCGERRSSQKDNHLCSDQACMVEWPNESYQNSCFRHNNSVNVIDWPSQWPRLESDWTSLERPRKEPDWAWEVLQRTSQRYECQARGFPFKKTWGYNCCQRCKCWTKGCQYSWTCDFSVFLKFLMT